MEIKKGNRFVCVKDVVMKDILGDGFREFAYINGNVYTSEKDACITNEFGEVDHCWTRDSDKYEFFTPYSKLDRVYTKYTEGLEKLFDAYDGNKYRIGSNKISFFDNCDSSSQTGYLCATGEVEQYYTDNNYTYLSEQAFIEFMGLLPEQETTAPQPHYDNSNGSLFSLSEQLGLNHWEFDILKRLVRCRKKGQFKEDLQKIKDTCDIYLREYK